MSQKGMSASELRALRQKTTIETLERCKKEGINIIYDKLVLEIQIRYGFTEVKAKEYVNTALRATEGILINGEITWKKK